MECLCQAPAQFPYIQVIERTSVAMAIGLLIGLEREWAHKEIGVRTFAITALLGALAAMASTSLISLALIGVFLLLAFLNTQSLLRDRSLELTTSAALLVTMVLGVLAGQGHFFTAIASAILTTMLLAWKLELSNFAAALKPEEIRSAVLLGLLSLVIYPLLPDRFIDPWRLVNPRQAWVVVVVIAGIGFVNYTLLRLYSTRGLYFGALLGGLVNSTATVAELGRLTGGHEEKGSGLLVPLLELTNVAMFARNLAILAIFARHAGVAAAPPLSLMAIAAAALAWLRRDRTSHPGQSLELSSPVSLSRVLKFGVLFLILSVCGTLGQRYLGNFGFLAVSLLGGLVSSASTTATAAALAASGKIGPDLAAIATVVTSIASAMVNVPLVYQQLQRVRQLRAFMLDTGITILIGAGVIAIRWWLMR